MIVLTAKVSRRQNKIFNSNKKPLNKLVVFCIYLREVYNVKIMTLEGIDHVVDPEIIHKAVERQITERVRETGSKELEQELDDAKHSYSLLIQQEQGTGKITFRPSEHKEQKRELEVRMGVIERELDTRPTLE